MSEAASLSPFLQETGGSATTGGMTKTGHQILLAKWIYTESQGTIL